MTTKVSRRRKLACYAIVLPLIVGWSALCALVTGWHHNPTPFQLLVNWIGAVIITWETCSVMFVRLPERRAKRDE